MKTLSLVSFSLLIVLSTACSKSVRLDSNGSNASDLSGESGQGTDPTGNQSPAPSSSVTSSPTPSSSVSSSPTPVPSSSVTSNPSPTPSPSSSITASSCSGGQVFLANSCVCPGTDGWDGKNCISCADNQLWNPTTHTCVNTCPQGQYATASGGCTSCPSGQSWDGTQCVSSSGSCGSEESCDSYKELTSPFVIPARDCSHTCYYVKLSSKIASQPSDDYTVYDTNVTARDHNNFSDLNPVSPHIIGSSATSSGATADIQFLMQGKREVMLTGDTSGSQDVYVDNFILVRLGMGGKTTYYGEGTADSLTYVNSSIPGDDGYINVAGQELKNYLIGAAGGTADFKPTDYGSTLELNTPIELKSEALDCGVVGQVSDIYLLFR